MDVQHHTPNYYCLSISMLHLLTLHQSAFFPYCSCKELIKQVWSVPEVLRPIKDRTLEIGYCMSIDALLERTIKAQAYAFLAKCNKACRQAETDWGVRGVDQCNHAG